jgi:hypothetical protein
LLCDGRKVKPAGAGQVRIGSLRAGDQRADH